MRILIASYKTSTIFALSGQYFPMQSLCLRTRQQCGVETHNKNEMWREKAWVVPRYTESRNGMRRFSHRSWLNWVWEGKDLSMCMQSLQTVTVMRGWHLLRKSRTVLQRYCEDLWDISSHNFEKVYHMSWAAIKKIFLKYWYDLLRYIILVRVLSFSQRIYFPFMALWNRHILLLLLESWQLVSCGRHSKWGPAK
jgi:hypothetical protein